MLTEISGKHRQIQIVRLMTDSVGRLHVYIALSSATLIKHCLIWMVNWFGFGFHKSVRTIPALCTISKTETLHVLAIRFWHKPPRPGQEKNICCYSKSSLFKPSVCNKEAFLGKVCIFKMHFHRFFIFLNLKLESLVQQKVELKGFWCIVWHICCCIASHHGYNNNNNI